MPQSRTRKAADQKRKVTQARKIAERQDANEAEREAAEPARRAAERRAERAAAREDAAAAKSSARSAKARAASDDSDDDDDDAPVKKPSERRTTAERRGLTPRKPATTSVRRGPVSRRWVPPVFITLFLLGVAWLIVYYVAGGQIPFMSTLDPMAAIGIGMGAMAASFIVATQWK